MEKVENKHLRTNTQQTSSNISNLEKIKALKKRADELSMEYHENIERLKFYDKDIEFMIRKMGGMDSKIEKLSIDYKYIFDSVKNKNQKKDKSSAVRSKK